MNVFMLSFPATLGLGLVMFALALPSVMGGIELAFGQLGHDGAGYPRVWEHANTSHSGMTQNGQKPPHRAGGKRRARQARQSRAEKS